ncbi:5237_t:CDS:2 [Gigaspora margarita]|uniref:5237_t:CDS:1 n=1 Tax=Gigaspora margarita TaxID=4874 RepID=A0ABN7VDX5_GIGMA|nr:5237_t:CDS:2 [Gigaspora margarita]
MFEEAGFDIYTSHELFEIRRPQRTKVEKAAEGNPLQTNAFVQELSANLELVLNKNIK